MKNFYLLAFIASTILALGITQIPEHFRRPAAVDNAEPFEIHISSLGLDAVSKIHSFDYVYVKAIFNETEIFELGKDSPKTLQRGEKIALDHRIEIKNSWIKDDSLTFRLEIVRNTTISPVLVRCSTISKQLSAYNRSYQCNIPGENKTPVLVYRLARRGSTPPSAPVAMNE